MMNFKSIVVYDIISYHIKSNHIIYIHTIMESIRCSNPMVFELWHLKTVLNTSSCPARIACEMNVLRAMDGKSRPRSTVVISHEAGYWSKRNISKRNWKEGKMQFISFIIYRQNTEQKLYKSMNIHHFLVSSDTYHWPQQRFRHGVRDRKPRRPFSSKQLQTINQTNKQTNKQPTKQTRTQPSDSKIEYRIFNQNKMPGMMDWPVDTCWLLRPRHGVLKSLQCLESSSERKQWVCSSNLCRGSFGKGANERITVA